EPACPSAGTSHKHTRTARPPPSGGSTDSYLPRTFLAAPRACRVGARSWSVRGRASPASCSCCSTLPSARRRDKRPVIGFGLGLRSPRSLPLPVVPRGLREASGSHCVPGLFHEVIGLLLEHFEEAKRRLALLPRAYRRDPEKISARHQHLLLSGNRAKPRV